MKKALIIGITGQDGSYLTELLLAKEYEVHGTIRRSSTFNTGRIDHLYTDPHVNNTRLFLHYSDLTDGTSLVKIIQKIQPDEIYNLGAQSHVRVSFDIPEYTAMVDALGTLKVLDAVKETNPAIRVYQASTSEMFGKVQAVPQREDTPFYPRSPYGVAKVFGYWIIRNYREAYNLYACNGILFNHESPRRGETFVTRKITRGLAKIKLGIDRKLFLGNLDSKRDWGYAPDYVKAMWQMMQQEKPDDYIIATNETHAVREFIEEAGRHLGMNITWSGSGVDEKGTDTVTGKEIIHIDPRYYRPTEVDLLIGDYSKAKRDFGWEPSLKFKELVKIMTEADFEHFASKKHLEKMPEKELIAV